jgi:hypothetical protein
LIGQSNSKGIGITCVDRLFQSTSSPRDHPHYGNDRIARESGWALRTVNPQPLVGFFACERFSNSRR